MNSQLQNIRSSSEFLHQLWNFYTSSACTACNFFHLCGPAVEKTAEIEDRVHFLLSCPALAETREDFLRQLVDLSPTVVKYMDVSASFLLVLLDPLSPMVPEEVRTSWVTDDDIYKWSRKFCYAMHKRRTKLIDLLTQWLSGSVFSWQTVVTWLMVFI